MVDFQLYETEFCKINATAIGKMIFRAPPSKMREPYSNHLVCLSVHPSVCLSTSRCNAITRKVFDLETSYFILHTQMEDKERKTPIDFGVKGQGLSDMLPAGPSLTMSVF